MPNLVKRFLCILALVSMTAACSSLAPKQHDTAVVTGQAAPDTAANSNARSSRQAAATLHLTGNFFGTILVINDQEPQKLEQGSFATYVFEGRRFAAIDIPAGEVRVYITRGNRVVIDRTLHALPGNAVGLRVP